MPLAASVLVALASGGPADAKDGREANLRQFALANCLYWYVRGKGWDDSDIRGVAGGFVETGDSDPDTYAEIATAIRDWHPQIATKSGADSDLVRCFHLEENEAVERIIAEETGR